MIPPPTMPRPCHDPACRGRQDPGERVALVAALCGARGAQMTAIRWHILELLWRQGSPMGAYALIGALTRETGRPIRPPTIYRALKFLMTQGLVTKIESQSAYIACAHPERPHLCLLFLCTRCGTSTELENAEVERDLAAEAARIDFQSARTVVEVEGLCANCTDAS